MEVMVSLIRPVVGHTRTCVMADTNERGVVARRWL